MDGGTTVCSSNEKHLIDQESTKIKERLMREEHATYRNPNLLDQMMQKKS
jgi:hypothetical protein